MINIYVISKKLWHEIYNKKQNLMLRVFHKCHQVIYLKIDWFDHSNWNRTLTSIVNILPVAGRQHSVCECFGWFYISSEIALLTREFTSCDLKYYPFTLLALLILSTERCSLKDALWKKQVNVSAFLLLLMALL